MKTVIGLSNFSFYNPNFSSFDELEEAFKSFKNIKSEYTQAKIGFSVGNDLVDNIDFGPSVNQQINNFEFGTDVGIKTAFQMRLHREYLNGLNLSLTTDELKSRSFEQPDLENKINYILYTPAQLLGNVTSFKDSDGFNLYYEKILGEYPVDSKSYYERVVSHFTNLIYQDDCESTLNRVSDDFRNYSCAFTVCLKELNAFSPTNIIATKEKVKAIKTLTSYDCTEEGSSHRNFKFSFTNGANTVAALNCEFHLKPSGNNTTGDGGFHQKRIYFGFFPINHNQWRVAIAAIGPHINATNSTDRFAKPKR